MGDSRHESGDEWRSSDSQVFMRYGAYYVPTRRAQLEIIATSMKDRRPVRVLDLGCGDGTQLVSLSGMLTLGHVTAVDSSPLMLARAAEQLAGFPDLNLINHDLAHLKIPADSFDVVCSSLAIHHLDDDEKARLYQSVFTSLMPGGVFVLADLVQPLTRLTTAIAAGAWDRWVREATSDAIDGEHALATFRDEGWNHFALTEPDPVDKPASVAANLAWLADAGFAGSDVVWLNAGHAIFLGEKR